MEWVKYFSWFLLFLEVLAFILALWWESWEFQRVHATFHMPAIDKRTYERLTCLAYEDAVWRGAYILAFIAALAVAYTIKVFYNLNMTVPLFTIILFVIYVSAYVVLELRAVHLFGDTCFYLRSLDPQLVPNGNVPQQ